ncbi:MAG: zinc-dependent alcohol dehydrogenase family protein [Anaerolineae bacterium]|nr:zinc-dependent alcohol dehydrogenase family protein [Candidatus Roseilinea sp.]MDW8448690.1 zinc-dependent alcohol dehydrogenase family protein [Anaerolineae bacterium]
MTSLLFDQYFFVVNAVVFTQPGTISIERVPDPTCAPDEVIVKIAIAGICGTDVHIYRNEYLSKFPLIPGHEFGGTVVEVGSAVRDFKAGDRVAVDPNISCGQCEFCRSLQPNHCLNWRGVGITQSGAFAEYVAVPARVTYKLPDGLTDQQAAFIEPLSCVVYALNRIRVHPADEVLVFGAGPMGLLLIQALKHSGAARLVAVDKQSRRLELASQMGADHLLLGDDLRIKESLRDLAPHGFHIVVDATGVPTVIEQALDYLRPRGQYLQFGVAPMTATINWRPYDIFRRDWTIIGSFALSFTFQQAIAWLLNGAINVAPLVSHTLPLSEFTLGFREFIEGKTLKVHLKP